MPRPPSQIRNTDTQSPCAPKYSRRSDSTVYSRAPTSPTGTATLDVQVYTGDPALIAEQATSQPQPPLAVLMGYSGTATETGYGIFAGGGFSLLFQWAANWSYDSGGAYNESGYAPNDS